MENGGINLAIGDIIVGIDIGTTKVCTVVGEVNNFGQIETISSTSYKCSGLKKGKIINEDEISLSIAKDFRGKGFAQDFLKLGIESMMKEWFFIRKIIAEVKVENIASNKMFTKYGFSFVEKKAIKNLYELNIEK